MARSREPSLPNPTADMEVMALEGRYQILFRNALHGFVVQDANGMIISANPAAERILGLSLNQLQGRDSTDPRWHAIHEDGSPFPGDAHPAMVAPRRRSIRDLQFQLYFRFTGSSPGPSPGLPMVNA